MKAIVVGSGAGGATAARELAEKGFEVMILEAGKQFHPLTRLFSKLSPLRGTRLIKNEQAITKFFPHLRTQRSSSELAIVMGITTGGCTAISTGNILRAETGFKEIGLDLRPEFEEIEQIIPITTVPKERWRPLTQRMFDESEKMGFAPTPTPKALNLERCASCGYCELGCSKDAKWTSMCFLQDLHTKKISLETEASVQKVIIKNGCAKGLIVSRGSSIEQVDADVIVLAAGGVGTAQILKASNLPARDNLWIDVVLTVGGIYEGSQMLNEPPMVWVIKQDGYIISPYFDLLSYWFHKPWRDVSLKNRVGVMIKLADTEQGSVDAHGNVVKALTPLDYERLNEAKTKVKAIMEASGVKGPFVDGLLNGGHLGGTVPLTKADVSSMHPYWLPDNLWVADLSLLPHSQGLPTILTTAALALRVARRIAEAYH